MSRRFILLIAPLFLLAACDAQTESWLGTGEKDKDKAMAALPQPDVMGMNSTLERQATEAMDKGEFNRAGQFYKQMIDSPKGTADEKFRYKLGFAEAMRRAGQPAPALDLYIQLLKEKPDNIDAAEGKALSLMQTGKATDAGRAFADIIEKDKTRWRTLNALGILFVNKNMIPEATAYFTEALNQSPDNPSILNNVALSQAVEHSFARSFETFEQAIRMSANEAQRRQISLNMAMVYGISGDIDTASSIASKYLEGPALDNNLGLYAHLARDDNLARTYLDMALSGSATYYERAQQNLDAINSKKQ
jgi:Flp pilus assembly protein TadD